MVEQTKTSLILTTYNRTKQLDATLQSIIEHNSVYVEHNTVYSGCKYPLEIVVVNDGSEAGVEEVCRKNDVLDIKYVSTNRKSFEYRSSVFANNIGVKASTGDIIILSCAEIYHLTPLYLIIEPLLTNKKLLTIPRFLYFDNTGDFTNNISDGNKNPLVVDTESIVMPFLMGMWKKEFMDIGGYDEDFIGYAGDDNDLMDRLQWNGCRYFKTSAVAVHLYHGPRCDGIEHFENPKWVYNYNLRASRKGIISRNANREWGTI